MKISALSIILASKLGKTLWFCPRGGRHHAHEMLFRNVTISHY